MNLIIIGFVSISELIPILLLALIFIILIVWLIIAFIRYLNRSSRQKLAVIELESQFKKYQDTAFEQKDIRDYFPVKEGNKISLIQFDEIVDFSASNNYIFLTDTAGKDYLVDSNLTDLETKLPNDFIRVHKSTIVNSKLISEVKKLANGRYDLVMKCEKERIIQCSKNYNDKIKSIIDFN